MCIALLIPHSILFHIYTPPERQERTGQDRRIGGDDAGAITKNEAPRRPHTPRRKGAGRHGRQLGHRALPRQAGLRAGSVGGWVGGYDARTYADA